jgi:hypothetical protein
MRWGSKSEVNIFMIGLESSSFFSFHEHNLRQQTNMNLIYRYTDHVLTYLKTGKNLHKITK